MITTTTATTMTTKTTETTTTTTNIPTKPCQLEIYKWQWQRRQWRQQWTVNTIQVRLILCQQKGCQMDRRAGSLVNEEDTNDTDKVGRSQGNKNSSYISVTNLVLSPGSAYTIQGQRTQWLYFFSRYIDGVSMSRPMGNPYMFSLDWYFIWKWNISISYGYRWCVQVQAHGWPMFTLDEEKHPSVCRDQLIRFHINTSNSSWATWSTSWLKSSNMSSFLELQSADEKLFFLDIHSHVYKSTFSQF